MNLLDQTNTQIVRVQTWLRHILATDRFDERGNVTMEHVLWAALVVALVGTVSAVLIQFVNSKLAVLS